VLTGIRGSNMKLEKIYDALLEQGRAQHQSELGE